MPQSCNPSYSGGRNQENHTLRPAWVKNFWDPISTNKSGMWWHPPVILALQGSINGRITVQASPGIKWDPISKITNAKRAGGHGSSMRPWVQIPGPKERKKGRKEGRRKKERGGKGEGRKEGKREGRKEGRAKWKEQRLNNLPHVT
jgi:hypothetical protein